MGIIQTRAIRGAIDVEANTEEAILRASKILLEKMVAANQIYKEDVVSVLFTTTKDLNATYPARAARQLGWTQVPLMCVQEMDVPGNLASCLRVLIVWNTERNQAQQNHVYLGAARILRPDLVKEEEEK